MYTQQQMQPQAYVTVGKNRPKKGNQVYLKDGQEFEIELFNPLTETILAQIWLNDEVIGGGGIVLRPGEKIYLERYLDKAKKFKFETYQVAKGNVAVDNAIRNNGKVKIQFFKEIKNFQGNPIVINDGNWWTGWNNNWNSPNYNPLYGTTTNINSSGICGNSTLTSGSVNFNSNHLSDSGMINCSSYTSNVNFDPNDLSLKSLADEELSNDAPQERKLSKKVKETGRVAEGSNSNQAFTYVNMTFSTWSFHSVEYQILPTSVKPMTKSDIKNYCTKCGVKQKSGWIYCPKCRTKFE